MININLIILEDNPIDKIKMEIMISEFVSQKYTFITKGIFESYEQTVKFLDNNPIDLIVTDIFNNKKPLGLDLLKYVHKKNIPVILMTQSLEVEVYEQAKVYGEVNYLIKPFHKLTLQSMIEKVYAEWSKTQSHQLLNAKYLFLRNMNNLDKIAFDDIVFLEADGNYCFIHTINRKYVQKKSMTKILEGLGDSMFVRIHHKYVVNSKYVNNITSNLVIISNRVELPIGKSFRKNIHAVTQN